MEEQTGKRNGIAGEEFPSFFGYNGRLCTHIWKILLILAFTITYLLSMWPFRGTRLVLFPCLHHQLLSPMPFFKFLCSTIMSFQNIFFFLTLISTHLFLTWSLSLEKIINIPLVLKCFPQLNLDLSTLLLYCLQPTPLTDFWKKKKKKFPLLGWVLTLIMLLFTSASDSLQDAMKNY